MKTFLSKEDLSLVKSAILPFRALNHGLRQKILVIIDMATKKKGGIRVTDIHLKLKIEQSVASQQLAILREVKIVKTRRDGKFIYYFIDNEKVKEIVNKAKELAAGIK